MSFFKDLQDFGYMMSISEVGLGVPMANYLTDHSGASKVLFRSRSDYAKESSIFHGAANPPRAVSRENVSLVAAHEWSQSALEIERMGYTPIIVSVSGAHKREHERGESHGWICVRTPREGEQFCHFRLHKNASRNAAIRKTLEVLKGFITHAVFFPGSWNDGVKRLMRHADVDVIDSTTLRRVDALHLCTKDNPIVWDSSGKMVRAVDVIRENPRWYRGSFDPITSRHQIMAEKPNTVLEISLTNARKNTVPLLDIADRIEMIRRVGLPVMITKGRPTFVDFDEMLDGLGAPDSRFYTMGSDTFNAVVSDRWCPTPDYLAPLRCHNLTVYHRPGEPVEMTKNAEDLTVTIVEDAREAFVSSTNSRKTLDGLDSRVLEYIEAFKLYRD